MLSSAASQSIATEVQNFFKSPAVSRVVLNNVLKKRPTSWGKRSNAPYYAEHYAVELQGHVDRMIEDKQDLVFVYKEYPSIKPSTLYLRVNQSFLFLRENMDENFKYTNLNNQIHILREKECIRFTYKEQYREGMGALKAHSVAPASKAFVWKEKVDTFLEQSTVTKLHIDKLLLSPEQISDLNASLAGVQGIIFNIDAHSIKIIKVNDAN